MAGTAMVSQKVTAPVGSTGPDKGHYTFQWDNSGAPSGVYIFQAVAVAGFGSRTQGMPVSIALNYYNGAPPPPTGLTVSSVGNNVVNLVWSTPSTGYVDHYEVWRSLDGVSFTNLADAASESYMDPTVTNGTTYYYKVKTVDDDGLAGLLSEAVSATPNESGDSVAPSVPTSLVATADPSQPTVHLAWGESIDGGTPATGLSGYVIERGPNGAGPWTVLQGAYGDVVYDDIAAGWSTTWYYRVRAVDDVGNASAYATVGPVTTVPIIYRDITVTNNSGADVYVWVQNAATLTWYATDGAELTWPVSGERVKKGKAVTWSSVPGGIYNVYYSSTSAWPVTFLKTEAVNASAGNGTTSYP
jgi:predicted phage tail protein